MTPAEKQWVARKALTVFPWLLVALLGALVGWLVLRNGSERQAPPGPSERPPVQILEPAGELRRDWRAEVMPCQELPIFRPETAEAERRLEERFGIDIAGPSVEPDGAAGIPPTGSQLQGSSAETAPPSYTLGLSDVPASLYGGQVLVTYNPTQPKVETRWSANGPKDNAWGLWGLTEFEWRAEYGLAGLEGLRVRAELRQDLVRWRRWTVRAGVGGFQTLDASGAFGLDERDVYGFVGTVGRWGRPR